MNTIDDEQELLHRIAALPREIRPSSDLWPGIAKRIDPASSGTRPVIRRFPLWPAAIAASVLMVFCVSMLMTRPWQSTSASPDPLDMVEVQDVASPETEILTLRSASESEYVAAFREFLAIHPAPAPEAAPAADWIGETRAVLHKTEMDLAAALRLSPDDPLLQERMAALRAYQLEWLKQMAAAERNSRRIST